jgi:hypothetical protein
MRSELEK